MTTNSHQMDNSSNPSNLKDRIKLMLAEKVQAKLNPQPAKPSTSTLLEGADDALKIVGLAKTFGAKDVDVEGGVIATEFESRQALDHFTSAIEDLDMVDSYEIRIEGEDGEVTNFESLPEDVRAVVIVYVAAEFIGYGEYEDEVDYDESEVTDDAGIDASAGELTEVKRKIKVNFRGKKRIKMQCNPGFKWNPATRTCEKIEGAQLAANRKSQRRAVLTKRSMGTAFKRRVIRKSAKARRYRKALGLT